MMDLREYQTEVIIALYREINRGNKRIILVAPTGSGKTIMGAAVIKDCVSRHREVLVLAHRREIIAQIADKLRDLGITCGIIQAGHPYMPLASVQVASVQTLWHRAMRSNRMELPPARLVVVDECHHATAKTWRKIIDSYPDAIIIGLTATPCRGDGKGLGGIFETIVECPQVAELIELKYLVPTKVYAPSIPNLDGVKVRRGDYVESELARRVDTSKLVGDIVENWLRYSERRRTVCFATGVGHSQHIRDRFLEAGVRAAHIDGDTPKAERDATLAQLDAGAIDVVTNCMVLTEGWDQPPVSCCILARPTRQMGLFRQMVGRVLRPSPGKPNAIILDHSGAVFKHGLPEDPVLWTLSEDKSARNAAHDARKGDEFGGPKLLDCTECGALREGGKACPCCGFKPTRAASAFVHEDGDLALVNGRKPGKADIDRAEWHAMMVGYCVERSWNINAASHKYREKFGDWPPVSSSRVTAIPPNAEVRSWFRSRAIAWRKAQEKAQGASL